MSDLAGYIRVSSEVQVDAYGPEVQQDNIQTWADLTGHRIVEWFHEDAVSGTVDGGDRPVLASILTRADEFHGIVMFDATRIARRLIVQETLLSLVWATGLKVYTTTAGEMQQDEEDPTKILIRQILGVIAEFDHRTTVKKLHQGRKAKMRSGGYGGGGTRYGTSVSGHGKQSQLVEDGVELETVRLIKRLHSYGTSMRQIATTLNEAGVPTKTGKGTWQAVQISRILAR